MKYVKHSDCSDGDPLRFVGDSTLEKMGEFHLGSMMSCLLSWLYRGKGLAVSHELVLFLQLYNEFMESSNRSGLFTILDQLCTLFTVTGDANFSMEETNLVGWGIQST